VTGLENKLRAALRETAGEIPDDPPPLRLSPLAVSRPPARRRPAKQHWAQQHGARWPAWAAPLAAAAAIVALVVASLTLVHDRPNVEGPSTGQATTTPSGLAGVPPRYVALVTPQLNTNPNLASAPAAEVRATATGAVLARVVPLRPYVSFTAVTAAADDRTFVLAARKKTGPPGYPPPTRLFVLRTSPAGGRASLRALPAGFIPRHADLRGMALSPDGAFLAAQINGGQDSTSARLYLLNLATGTSRSWAYRDGGGLGTGPNGSPLSWTADGKYLAYVGAGQPSQRPERLWLLDVSAPGSDLAADSRLAAGLPPKDQADFWSWREAAITGDGRTAVFVEELLGRKGQALTASGFRLLTISVATGRVTVVNNQSVARGSFPYEQLLYANATGSALIVSRIRPGATAGVLRGHRYTPLPWSPHIVAAAW
jgi:hypothetical protein